MQLVVILTPYRFVNFWFALYIPTALNKISWKLYIIFAAICFAAAISTFLFQVETANRSLEEMDAMFEEGRTMFPFLDDDLTVIHPKRDEERREYLREVGQHSTAGKSVVDDAISKISGEADSRIEHV